MYDENKITYFAETDFRNQKTKFGIRAKDRSRHMYVIGKTGMGKSTLLENMAIQDIQNDEGMIFIDPHGSTALKLLDYIPPHRLDDVIYFAPHDTDYPIAFNVLEQVPYEKRNAVAGGLMSAFKKIWVDSFSSRMEYLLNYTLLALLDVPGTTLLSINRLLSDKAYRKTIVDQVSDSLVKNFWTNEFDKYSNTYATEAVAPIQNKVGQFIASPMIRNIIGQDVSNLDFRRCMDERKIVIINISKGIIGPENMRLLGGMLITKIQLAAMSRANLSSETLSHMPNTYLYVDEFQNFANESFTEILSESRKYKLCLTVANQYMDQMTEDVRNAVIGNVGTFISFRVGSTDAEIMEKEFAPQFLAEDMVNLGFAQIYLKLMIDGVSSKPFSATTIPGIPKPVKSFAAQAVAHSRKHYSNLKENVEANIKAWTSKEYGPAISFGERGTQNAPRDNRGRNDDRARNGNGKRDNQSKQGDRNNRNNDRRRDERPKQDHLNLNKDSFDTLYTEMPQKKEVKIDSPDPNRKRDNNGNGNHKKRIDYLTKEIIKEEKNEFLGRDEDSEADTFVISRPKAKVNKGRISAKKNMEKMHALSQNTKKIKAKTDEVPEDLLRALLAN